MPKRLALAVAFAAASLSLSASAKVVLEEVTYKDGDTPLKGYLAYDDAKKGPRPGILVVHEWWGITKHVKDYAQELARKGYTALAVDMYGNGKTADDPKSAGALSGSVVLDMARAGVPLTGVASFHGNLQTQNPAKPGVVKAKVLVMNGADDPFVKPDSIDAFKKEMEAAKADYRFINYPGAVHAFTNPEATAKGKEFNLPLAYHPEADRKSKAEMLRFFSGLFGKR